MSSGLVDHIGPYADFTLPYLFDFCSAFLLSYDVSAVYLLYMNFTNIAQLPPTVPSKNDGPSLRHFEVLKGKTQIT